MKHPAIAVTIFLVGALIPLAPTASPIAASSAPVTRDFGEEIFHAVLEGLYEDGLHNDTVDLVLKQRDGGGFLHFVPGCPVCIFVLEAFRHYRSRPDFVSFKTGGNTWGKGLVKELRDRLGSDQMKVRLGALRDLIERWLDRRMDRLRVNKRERQRWLHEMQDRSKQGMNILRHERESGGMQEWGDESCPSCDGVVAGTRAR